MIRWIRETVSLRAAPTRDVPFTIFLDIADLPSEATYPSDFISPRQPLPGRETQIGSRSCSSATRTTSKGAKVHQQSSQVGTTAISGFRLRIGYFNIGKEEISSSPKFSRI